MNATISTSSRLLGIVCLGLAGCAGQAAPPADDARPVRALTVGRSELSVDAHYSGEIRARYESRVGFKVGGKIAERLVEVGSQVVPGQPLMRLDAQDAALTAASATAESEAARVKAAQSRADLERYERLYSEKYVSKAALDQYRFAYEAAMSQLRSVQAQQRLSLNQRAYTVLTADRAGVVTAIDVEAGQVVSAGQPVLTMAADGEREVLVSVPESRVEELRTATRMTMATWANPQRRYTATLRELAPDTDKATRTYAARIAIVEPDAALRLGMTASVEVTGAADASAIRIPLSAIYEKPSDRPGRPLVWVVDPRASTVDVRPVKIAAVLKDSVLVAGGVKAGDTIVTAGVHMLQPGQKVRVLRGDAIGGAP